jgi:hypothetical protein
MPRARVAQVSEWLPEIKRRVHGDDVKELYLESDSDDTVTDDHWSSEEEGMQELAPPPPKLLPPPPPPPLKPAL